MELPGGQPAYSLTLTITLTITLTLALNLVLPLPDLVYGEGDTLTVVFDRATDRSRTSTGGVHAGGRLYVDGLFSFTAQLAALTLTLPLPLP